VSTSYLEFRAMDTVHKLSDPECYAPSSEQFRSYKFKLVCNIRLDYVLLISFPASGTSWQTSCLQFLEMTGRI
jgi:hypothetical protein